MKAFVALGVWGIASVLADDGCADVQPGYFMKMRGWMSFLDQMVVVERQDADQGGKGSSFYLVTNEDLPGALAVGHPVAKLANRFSLRTILRKAPKSVHCSTLSNMKWDAKVKGAREAVTAAVQDATKLQQAAAALEKIEAHFLAEREVEKNQIGHAIF